MSDARETLRDALRRWKGWRTEWVGVRVVCWYLVAEGFHAGSHAFMRLEAKANRRWLRRQHEYELRCQERA